MKNLNLKNQLCLVVLFTFGFYAFPISTSALTAGPKNPVPIQLKQVFTTKVISGNKDILKLYDDNTYEFLFFQIKNKKPVVKRERGTYHWKKNKLSLAMKGKTMIKEHSTRFIYKEEKGLYKDRFFDVKKAQEPEYAITADKKYWEPLYFDSVYGYITNDKKALKKIIQLKKEEPVKPAEAEQPSEPAKVSELINEDGEVTTTETNNSENFILPAGSLKKLKAVIVVGADEFDGNKEYIKEQKEVAKFLKNMGVNVTEYYYPNSKWEDIKRGASGANIFIYSGHGITYGESEKQGTIYINEGIIEGKILTEGLKLSKNALIIFNHACYSAGSSADDGKDIGIETATTRVEDYAKPFVNLKAGCYYANNYSGSVQPFLTDFFSGEPVNKIYRKYANEWDKLERIKKYKFNSKYETGISVWIPVNPGYYSMYSYDLKGKLIEKKVKEHKSYDVAYVGLLT